MNVNLDRLILDNATMSIHQVSLLPFDAQSSIPDRPNNLLWSHSSFATFLLTHAQRWCLNHQTISVAIHRGDKTSRELPVAEFMESLCQCMWLDVQPAHISDDIQKAYLAHSRKIARKKKRGKQVTKTVQAGSNLFLEYLCKGLGPDELFQEAVSYQ